MMAKTMMPIIGVEVVAVVVAGTKKKGRENTRNGG